LKLPNEIILRPRIRFTLDLPQQEVINRFKEAIHLQDEYLIVPIDNHLFIRLPQGKQFFWSPQLHLEIFDISDNECFIKGFFGPNPTVWTLFMFLHVVIGMTFLANLIWMYSNYILDNRIAPQMGVAAILIVLWLALYAGGTIGKRKGKREIQRLYAFMLKVIYPY